jgi:hypothetical protein
VRGYVLSRRRGGPKLEEWSDGAKRRMSDVRTASEAVEERMTRAGREEGRHSKAMFRAVLRAVRSMLYGLGWVQREG